MSTAGDKLRAIERLIEGSAALSVVSGLPDKDLPVLRDIAADYRRATQELPPEFDTVALMWRNVEEWRKEQASEPARSPPSADMEGWKITAEFWMADSDKTRRALQRTLLSLKEFIRLSEDPGGEALTAVYCAESLLRSTPAPPEPQR